MNPAEAAVLLAGIATLDNRKPGAPEDAERTATLWAAVLHDVSLRDAGQAVTEHFATSTDYLMPAMIRRAVKRIRAKRIADHPPITPPAELADDVAATNRWLATARKRIGDGEQLDTDAAYGELKPRHLPDLLALMPSTTTDPAALRREIRTEETR